MTTNDPYGESQPEHDRPDQSAPDQPQSQAGQVVPTGSSPDASTAPSGSQSPQLPAGSASPQQPYVGQPQPYGAQSQQQPYGAQPPQQPYGASPQPYGAAPQSGYAYPPAYPAQQPTNTLAIVALVGSFFIPIVGIVCGHIALSQIKKSGEQGRGLALAGLIIGYALTALILVGIVIYFIFIAVMISTFGTVSTYS